MHSSMCRLPGWLWQRLHQEPAAQRGAACLLRIDCAAVVCLMLRHSCCNAARCCWFDSDDSLLYHSSLQLHIRSLDRVLLCASVVLPLLPCLPRG
jgi:hypothetical protein